MPVFKAPVDDTLFILNDVLGIERYSNLAGFADASPDVVEAIVQEAAKFSEEVLFPLNQVGDQQGCKRADDGSVTTPEGFKAAYKQYCESGWLGLAADPEYGGQGLPYTLHTAIGEYMSSANMALMMYPGLTQGAIAAIQVHGDDAQKWDAPTLAQKYGIVDVDLLSDALGHCRTYRVVEDDEGRPRAEAIGEEKPQRKAAVEDLFQEFATADGSATTDPPRALR